MSKNPLPAAPAAPVVPVIPALPASGALAYREGSFYQVHAPLPPLKNFRFVEILLGMGPKPPRVLDIDPAGLSAAIARGEVTILPKPAPLSVNPPPRPYPFEAAREAARTRRARLWNRRDVVELRRRGLLMTGEEYIRLLARRARPAPLPAGDRDD